MNPAERVRTPQFWFVLILFALLMGLAHLDAERRARKDSQTATAIEQRTPRIWQEQEGEIPAPHSILYYRIVLSIWVAVVLLTVALSFYALARPGAPSNYWVLFWTFSYLAYLVHFYWAAGVMYGWNFTEILNSKLGTNPNPEKVVCNPIPDLILTVWWGVDVILAWFVLPSPRWLRFERGALSLVTLVMFFGATVLAVKAGPVVHVLGVLMVVTVLSCYALRIALRPMEPGSFASILFVYAFRLLNLFRPWYRLPTWLGIINLAALREVLRANNLHSTSSEVLGQEVIGVSRQEGRAPLPDFDSAFLTEREIDGYYNDLHDPQMGSGSVVRDSLGPILQSNPGARFGRNIPLSEAFPKPEAELLQPSPREISRRLLARDKFTPASILNYLAAAWIQFETHDWFFHGNPQPENEFKVPLSNDDPWPENPMLIRRTQPDPTRRPDDYQKKLPPTYVNVESHWWDGSQIYGNDPAEAKKLRHYDCDPNKDRMPNGKLYMKGELLPLNRDTGTDKSGFTGNWWIGLSLLHTLFTREHNTLCDFLNGEYPSWDADRIYRTARMINAAVMAKIHTVEWTPAILPNPVLKIGMNANWWGLLSANVRKAFGRVSENEGFSGITGSETAHHAAPFALTEEFVAVYRMHPLMRDDIDVYRIADGRFRGNVPLPELLNDGARRHIIDPTDRDAAPPATLQATMADWFYSFGICNPGALVLRNYPNFLRDLKRPDGERIDLASVDILRDRERAIPRYNRFRELFHLPRVTSFEEMCADRDLAKELKDVYKDVDRVDMMVGAYAETPPPLFGFSDTAFRVFILMASRRLKSDRFFTTDFTPEVYSPAGMDWIANNGMKEVLLRHYPELAPTLRGVDNPFAPWKTIAQSREYQPYEDRQATAEARRWP